MFITTAGGGMIAASVVGGLLGGGGGKSSKSQSSTMDQRIGNYVYGQDGNGGLLADARNLYRQQFDQGGLNPMQTGGLEMQRQTLMSPQYTQGYDAMRSMGLGLMGGGVAGNPFTGGQTIRPTTNMDHAQFSYSQGGVPQSVLTAVTSPIQQAQAPEKVTTMQEDVLAIVDEYMRANKLGKYAEQAQDYGGSGGGYDFGGNAGGWGGGYGFGDGNSGMGD